MKYYKLAKDLPTFHWKCDNMLKEDDEIQS